MHLEHAHVLCQLGVAGGLGGPALVSYIHPRNARSIALAERLGAARAPGAAPPAFEVDVGTLVYRHPSPRTLIEEAGA